MGISLLQATKPFEMIAIGLEGSANKLGVGVISHPPNGEPAQILSNIRHTFVSPPGEGFLPKDTAKHHRSWVVKLVKQAMSQAGVAIKDVDCSSFFCSCAARTEAADLPVSSEVAVKLKTETRRLDERWRTEPVMRPMIAATPR